MCQRLICSVIVAALTTNDFVSTLTVEGEHLFYPQKIWKVSQNEGSPEWKMCTLKPSCILVAASASKPVLHKCHQECIHRTSMLLLVCSDCCCKRQQPISCLLLPFNLCCHTLDLKTKYPYSCTESSFLLYQMECQISLCIHSKVIHLIHFIFVWKSSQNQKYNPPPPLFILFFYI